MIRLTKEQKAINMIIFLGCSMTVALYHFQFWSKTCQENCKVKEMVGVFFILPDSFSQKTSIAGKKFNIESFWRTIYKLIYRFAVNIHVREQTARRLLMLF